MNKIKNVFQKTKQDKRPQQFLKRHSLIETPNIELSEIEKPIYESWWNDLDPFHLEKINNQTLLKFLSSSGLQNDTLEQILTLFEPTKEGLNKIQFFAMLRLIAHAQNGRKISRALVYLGAPIPYFSTKPMDAILKSDKKKSNELDSSWWDKPSFISTFTPIYHPTHQLYHHENNLFSTDLNSNLYDSTHCFQNTNLTIITSNIIPSSPTHGRSKSASAVTEFLHSFESINKLEESHTLDDFNINTGKTLLLTQKFVYQSPSQRHQEIIKSNNPFHHMKQQESPITSPFEDDSYPNQKPNSLNVIPPIVPSQFTKPAFPKYTRNKNTFF